MLRGEIWWANLISQVVAIDRVFFTERVGYVSNEIMQRVENGLRLILDL